MGLDCTHGFWNGSYGAFMRWRTWLAAQAGIPLSLMEGFYGWDWGDEGVLTFERDYYRITYVETLKLSVQRLIVLQAEQSCGLGLHTFGLIHRSLQVPFVDRC